MIKGRPSAQRLSKASSELGAPSAPSGPQFNTDISGPHHCQAMAGFTAEMLSALLIERAERNGGIIDVPAILEVCGAVKETPPDLWRFYRSRFDNCMAAARLDKPPRIEDRNSLSRLITSTFSHLFSAQSSGAVQVPRRFAGPFHDAISAFLGDERMGELRRRCDATVDNLQRTFGLDFTWEEYFHHPEAMLVLDDVRSDIVAHFANFDRRIKWLQDFFANESGSTGRLDQRNIRLLLTALFIDWLDRPKNADDTVTSQFLNRLGAFGLADRARPPTTRGVNDSNPGGR